MKSRMNPLFFVLGMMTLNGCGMVPFGLPDENKVDAGISFSDSELLVFKNEIERMDREAAVSLIMGLEGLIRKKGGLARPLAQELDRSFVLNCTVEQRCFLHQKEWL